MNTGIVDGVTAKRVPPIPAGDAVRFVSLNGDDSNNGLGPDTAFRTINTAVQSLTPLGYGTINISAGVHLLFEMIQLTSNITLQGAGMNATVLKINGNSGDRFGFGYAVMPKEQLGNTYTRCAVRDLTIDGNRTGGVTQTNCGGGLNPGDFWNVERVRFTNLNYLKLFINAVIGVRVRDCYFDNTQGTADNIGGGGCTDVLIQGCYFHTDITGTAIDFVRGVGYKLRDNHLSTGNIYFEGVTDSIIEGNYIAGGTIKATSNYGYAPVGDVLENPRNVKIRNNIIKSPVDVGVVLLYADYATASTHLKGGGNEISSNHIKTTPKMGILVYADSDTMVDAGDWIVGNHIEDPNDDGINSLNTGLGTGQSAGITIDVGIGSVVRDNQIVDTRGTAKMQYGVALGMAGTAGVTMSRCVVSDNPTYRHTLAPVLVERPEEVMYGKSTIVRSLGQGQGASLVTPITVANTVTETLLFQATIPGGFFDAGTSFMVEAAGLYGSTSGTTNTVTLRIRLGSITGVIPCTVAPIMDASFSNKGWSYRAILTLRTAGATGTLFGNSFVLGEGSLTLAEAVRTSAATATVAVNTVGDWNIILSAQWSAANAANTITCHNCSITPVLRE
jgi:hypothetical protein